MKMREKENFQRLTTDRIGDHLDMASTKWEVKGTIIITQQILRAYSVKRLWNILNV